MSSPPPIPQSEWQKPIALDPNFPGALRGLWSLTWRTQLTWRRLPGLLISILAIPLLTFFTVDPPKTAPTASDWQDPPRRQVAELRRNLRASRSNLSKDQVNQLLAAIEEESGKVRSPTTGPGARGGGQF